MKKLLMLGNSYCTREMVEHAKAMGVYTIVTDGLPPEKSSIKLFADEYWMIDTSHLDELEQKCREEGITAVASGISEFNQDMALELCERLGLPNYATKDAWQFNRNKAKFKALCKQVGAPVATDYYLTDALTDEELDAVQFPVVVKPVDGCGNKGISFCYNREELIKAYRYARSMSNNSTIIVERLITGREYACVYAIADGEPALVVIDRSLRQPGEPSNCYILSTTIFPDRKHYFDEVDEYVKKVLKGAGCKEGMAFVQVMPDPENGGDYLIEMGYRLPGDLLFMPAKELNHFDAAKWMLECALGIKHTREDLPAPPKEPYTACAASYLLWNNKPGVITEINGIDEIRKIPGVKVITDNCNVGDYRAIYGRTITIQFSSADCDELCEKVKMINQLIEIKNENGEDMLIRFTDFDTLKDAYRQSLAE